MLRLAPDESFTADAWDGVLEDALFGGTEFALLLRRGGDEPFESGSVFKSSEISTLTARLLIPSGLTDHLQTPVL